LKGSSTPPQWRSSTSTERSSAAQDLAGQIECRRAGSAALELAGKRVGPVGHNAIMPFDFNDLDGLDGLHLGFRDFGLMATGFVTVKRRFPKSRIGL
jgi:hypothetical protein